MMDKDELLAVARHPGPDVKEILGQLDLFGRDDTGRWQGQPLSEPGNWGFDTHLFSDKDHHPSILHFSHGGHYLMATCWSDQSWMSTRAGRQGDGYNAQAEVS